MDYIKDVFSRMNLRQIRGFLLFGTDDFDEQAQPYSDKLKKSSDPIFKRLESIYPDGAERDEATGEMSDALAATEYVYMELGMKAGARLLYQLLLTDDKPSGPPSDK